MALEPSSPGETEAQNKQTQWWKGRGEAGQGGGEKEEQEEVEER